MPDSAAVRFSLTSTGVRRAWVPWYIGVMIGVALLNAVLELHPRVNLRDDAPTAGLIALALPFMFSPFAKDVLVPFGDRPRMDEFERAALARATGRAYLILLTLILFAFFYVWVALGQDWPTPTSRADWSAWGQALLMTGIGLPIFLAEVTIPLPPKDESEDHDDEV